MLYFVDAFCAWKLHQPFGMFVILSVENSLISIYDSDSFSFSNCDKQCRKRWVIAFSVYVCIQYKFIMLWAVEG
jgi:hypothetical protein